MDLLLPLFFLTTFIKITTLPHLVLSVNPQDEACAPKSCSPLAPPFSYPFWIHGQHPSYCGEPGFEISSEDKPSILQISGKTFVVVSVFDSSNSLLLIDKIAYKISCGMPLSNLSLDGTPFIIASGNYDLYFFYNCTTSPGVKSYPVSCATDPSLYSFADFYEASFMSCSGNYLCQFVISAPVDVRANESGVMAMSSIDIVKMGFLVNRKANNCSECKACGGRCGFQQNGLVCVCPDGPDQETGGNDGNRVRMKIGIGAGVGFVAVMSAVLFVLCMHRRKKYGKSSVFMRSVSSMYSSRTDFDKGGFSYDVPIFNYDELAKATNNFDPATEIGDGGFGTVFKGKLRDGRVVAVKRLYEHNCKRVEQFMNEVDILTRLRHPNLISLYGCTSRQSSRLLLVYEYISNRTVADHIHGDPAKPGLPPWLTRLNIAVETSTALVYLHASDVIHRDLKTSNILLNENFTVKVADFGLSRLFPLDVTHISTAPQGTPGYVDPEYHHCYQLTEKSDVYSFGVVLIELISSLPAVDIMRHRHEINLSALALSKIQANELHELVDANLGFQSDENTREMITAVAELAFQCLQPRHDERPSMQEVLETLKWIRKCGCKDEKADDGEDTSDDAVLLKNNPPILSPDSVTVKWVSISSTSTTRNASA